MKATGMLGAMKMESFIVDPFDVDAPLLSIDRIQAMGNDTLYMEIYDTCLDPERKEEGFENVKKKYAELNDVPLKENWYDHLRYGSSIIKKVKKGQSDALDACIEEYAEAYLELLKKAAPCDHDRKKEKAREYSDGLIENGGPATDAFLKSWGKEKTAEYFAKVLFG